MAYTQQQFEDFANTELTNPKPSIPWGPVVGLGLPIGGFLAGFMRTKSGARVWDVFFKYIQHAEGSLPLGIGSTFRTSEFLSPFAAPEKWNLLPLEHPDLFKSKGFQDYISRITGVSLPKLRKTGAFTKGLEWEREAAELGTLRVPGGPTLSRNVASISTGPRRGGTLLEWFARVSGVKQATFFQSLKEEKGYLRPAWMPAAAQGSRAKLTGKYAYSIFSWATGRMNLLLTSPMDLEVIRDAAKKIPIIRSLNLGVKPGTGAQMLGRYAAKAGVALLGYHALKYADYLASEFGPAAGAAGTGALGAGLGLGYGIRYGKKAPGRYGLIGAGIGAALGLIGPFKSGPLAGTAETYARIQIGRAGISQDIGLGEGVRKTEDYFPGLTKPTTLVASAGVGLLLGGTHDWAKRLYLTQRLGTGHVPGSGSAPGKGAVRGVYEQFDIMVAAKRDAVRKVYDAKAAKQSGLGKLITELKGKFFAPKGGGLAAGRYAAAGMGIYGVLATTGSAIAGDYPGAGVQAAAGAGALYAYAKGRGGLALGLMALPFLLREKDDPEKLKRIYSGEELVPVKSGRYWEAGRSSYEGKRPYFRPHRVAMMRSGAHETALYGSRKAYWESDPIFDPLGWLWNPYEREELMWQTGYKFPVTKTPFEDYPVLGPLLAATIGRGIKPAKFMGKDQWREEELSLGPGGERELPSEEPISRIGIKGTIGEQIYRFTELCLAGETEILLADMTKVPIKEIEVGDSVWTEEGKKRITNKFSHLLEKQENLRRISVQGIHVPIRITYGHEIFGLKIKPCHKKGKGTLCTLNGSREGKHCKNCIRKPYLGYLPEWIEVGSLEKGDYWINLIPKTSGEKVISTLDFLPEEYFLEGKRVFREKEVLIKERKGSTYKAFGRVISRKDSTSYIRVERKETNLPREIELDSDFGWLCGYTLAEGHIRKYQIGWGAHIKEVETNIKRLRKILKEKFSIEQVPYHIKKRKGEKTKGIEATISSVDFSTLMSSLLIDEKGKRLHLALLKSNKNFLLGLVNGFIDGDFHIRKKEASCGLSDKRLIDQLKIIFNSLGIFIGTGFQYTTLKATGKTYPIYRLHLFQSGIKKLIEYGSLGEKLSEIDLNSLQVGTERSFVLEGEKNWLVYHRVFENSPAAEEENIEVFDLEIEDQHTYNAGGLLVHNSGLPGFAMQSVKERITGTESYFEQDQWATPSLVAGAEPAWWSLELGGLAAASEGIRRYIPHRRRAFDYKNPLPSDLPSWLPGKDSEYFLDFSSAEIYSKIKEPWARLPGPGLASLRPELKGVHPEDYSAFQRYRVLADVSPWSREHATYNRMMSTAIAEGRLTPDELLEVQAIRKRVAETKKGKDFSQYRYGEGVEKRTVEISEEIEPGVYLTDAFGTAPIVLAGVDTSSLGLASVARLRDSSLTSEEALRQGERNRVQLSDYLREYLYPGAQVDVFVHKDPAGLMERGLEGMPQVEAVVSVGGRNINRELVERGLAQEMETSIILDSGMGTGRAQRLFGRFWENLTHGAETPLESFVPLAPVAKFMHQRTALEEYQRSEVYSREVGMWHKPIAHFLAPGLSTTAFWAGWRGLPREVKERYMVEEYFDRLQYLKSERLQRVEAARGQGELASQYASQMAKTKTGANARAMGGVLQALSAREKMYFREFVEAPTASEREQIARIVAPQMGEILHSQWATRAAEGAQMRREAGIGEQGDLATLNRFYASANPTAQGQRMAEIEASLESMPVPGPSWIGWSGGADIQDYKVKTIVEQGFDEHDFGIWRNDIRQANRRPWVHPISMAFSENPRGYASPATMRRRFNQHLGRAGQRLPRFTTTGGGERRIQIRSPGYDRLHRYLRDPSIMQF